MADSVNIDLMIPRIMANYKLHGPCTSGIACELTVVMGTSSCYCNV